MQIFNKLKVSYLIYFLVLKISANLDFLQILKIRKVFHQITYKARSVIARLQYISQGTF